MHRGYPRYKSTAGKATGKGDVCKNILCLVEFTKDLMGRGDLKAVKNCFRVAERMLKERSMKVRTAVEDVYVFSVSAIFYGSNHARNLARGLMGGGKSIGGSRFKEDL